jgi:UDP-glucose 4-epimerase
MTAHVVIGGCGFMGRHLVEALAECGQDVSAVDVAPFPGGTAPIETKRLDIVHASEKDFDAIIGTADVVHHFAWTTIPANANADPLSDLNDNLRMTLGILEALRRRGGGKIVFPSSGGTVYGRLRKVPVAEDHPLDPITAYGVSKVAAEKYLQFYRYLHGIDARVLRISNPYGAGQNPARQQGAISTFIHRALARSPVEIWGDGEVVRDFIHILDVIPAVLAVADLACGAGEQMPIFNIGSGTPASLNDIVRLIEHVIGSRVLVEHKPSRSFDVPVSVLDITKATRTLNWKPTIDLKEGIARTVCALRTDSLRPCRVPPEEQ